MDLHKLILPQDAVRKVLDMDVQEGWSTVKGELVRVIDSSMLGKRLFSFASVAHTESEVEEKCKEAVKTLLSLKEIGLDEIRAAVQSTLTVLDGVPGVLDLPDRRVVLVEYRGLSLKLSIGSLEGQVEACLQTAIRARAVESGVLCALPAESLVCSAGSTGSNASIKAECVVKASSARQWLSQKTNLLETRSADEFLKSGSWLGLFSSLLQPITQQS
eukprot:6455422-Amphidinium_carterae.3